ncbi:MAG: M12 family metallo-peptidase [Bryobacterales bacterium]
MSPIVRTPFVRALAPSRLVISALAMLIGVVAGGPAAFAQSAPEIFREIPAASLSTASDDTGLDGPSVVRSRYVEIDLARILPAPEIRDPAPSRARGTSSNRLAFNLFADTVHEFELERGEYTLDGAYVWYGRPTEGGGQALLVVRDGTASGSVRTASGEFYRIRGVSPGIHAIRQVTYQGAPPADDSVPVPESEIPQAAHVQQDAPIAEQSGTTTLDVMVVYTAGARQAAGGASGIQSEIQLAIAELNQSFSNSGVQMQARLAHSAEIAYSDEQNSLSTTLARLRTSGDGYMDQVHALRDQYGADVVALLVNGPGSNGGTVGTGYIMQTVGSYFSAYAFSVTEVNFATGPSYALLHEIGHNLGCAHDRANSSSAGAYPYAYGYQRSQTPRFRTIMSYNCSGVNCPTVNHWSNPSVNYQGYPTGVASSQSNSADNRQALNNTKATAAAWRAASSVNAAPTANSISPTSGSGSSSTFTASYADSNGSSDLRYAYVLMNTAASWAGSCGLRYDRVQNLLHIINDQGSAWMGGIPPGSGSMANSQCSVTGSGFAANSSGNTLTLTFPATFTSGFSGTRNVYLSASDNAELWSGWWQRGTWTVPGGGGSGGGSPVAPTADSISPSAGSGASQSFTARYSDGNGAGNLRYAYVLMNTAASWVGSCGLVYDRSLNRLQIVNDQGTGWLGSMAPNSGTLSNSQCSITGSGFSVSSSGNSLTLNFAATFTAGFSGTRNSYLSATDEASLWSGWWQRGNWTVPGGGGGDGGSPAAPTADSITPSSGSGANQSFTARFSDGNGVSDLRYAYLLINSGSTWPDSCGLRYDRIENRLQILNDQGSAWMGNVTPGSGTLSNSQCGVAGSGFSVSSSGNTLTLNVPATFASTFSGSRNLYLSASDSADLWSGWWQRGTWTVPGGGGGSGGGGGNPVAPTADSITPTSGSGATRTFTARFSDANGVNDLNYVYVLVNTGASWQGACGLLYNRLSNRVQMITDSGTGWQGNLTPGSGSLSNSQCSLTGLGLSVTSSGNTLTLTFPATFTSTFGGAKNVYLSASDGASLWSGWRLLGTWTVP